MGEQFFSFLFYVCPAYIGVVCTYHVCRRPGRAIGVYEDAAEDLNTWDVPESL